MDDCHLCYIAKIEEEKHNLFIETQSLLTMLLSPPKKKQVFFLT